MSEEEIDVEDEEGEEEGEEEYEEEEDEAYINETENELKKEKGESPSKYLRPMNMKPSLDEEDEMEEEEKPEEEEIEEVIPNPLTLDNIKKCLSLLYRSKDYEIAFTNLNITEKEISDITLLASYIHLRYVNVSNNFIKDISILSNLKQLTILYADINLLTTVSLDELPYLQKASFSNNKIVNTRGLNHPSLIYLNLNNNRIKQLTELLPEKLSALRTLELRSNRLISTEGLHTPNVESLYLSENKIRTLKDLGDKEKLKTLHLRSNEISDLSGFSENNKSLTYINFRSNDVTDREEIEKLKCLPVLQTLILLENPINDGEIGIEIRLEVYLCLRTLVRFNKEEYSEDEKQLAIELRDPTIQKEQMSDEEETDTEYN